VFCSFSSSSQVLATIIGSAFLVATRYVCALYYCFLLIGLACEDVAVERDRETASCTAPFMASVLKPSFSDQASGREEMLLL
jgi:hypothetical protein